MFLGVFSLRDMYEQFQNIMKMGPFGQIMVSEHQVTESNLYLRNTKMQSFFFDERTMMQDKHSRQVLLGCDKPLGLTPVGRTLHFFPSSLCH